MDKLEGTFIREMQGTPIHVNEDGKFIARIAGQVVQKPTIREIEKEIAKQSGGIRAFSFDGFDFREYRFIDVDRNDNFRDGSRIVHNSYHRFYHWDEEIIAGLKEIERQYEETMKRLENERDALIGRARRVIREDFKTRKPKNEK